MVRQHPRKGPYEPLSEIRTRSNVGRVHAFVLHLSCIAMTASSKRVTDSAMPEVNGLSEGRIYLARVLTGYCAAVSA
jgi:hypothetical protein